MNIRLAHENELKTIQELNHELFLNDSKFDNTFLMNWPFEKVGEDYFKLRIKGGDGVCFVAEVEEELVGYLAGGMADFESWRNVKKISELENMFVKESFRGQRIGEGLFQAFSQWSKTHGAERIRVIASHGNTRAIKFYERVGFSPYELKLEYKLQ